MSETAVIALGANLGDRLAALAEAVNRIRDLGEVVAVSPLYDTDPVGYADQPRYLNGVLLLETTGLSPETLLDGFQQIEHDLGRIRTFPNAPRTLDLDLLFFGDQIIRTDRLIVPHPRLHERAFVLVPLADLVPDLVHPLQGLTVRDLLRALPDRGGIVPSDERIPGFHNSREVH
jgi:2-amino-4-hydroxy-6-hydroxymethyldihydropteridine diphosphokinase